MWSGLIENVQQQALAGLIGKKFKFVIDSVGRTVSMQEQIHVIEMFKKFNFRDEDVDLCNPELIFRVVENNATGHQYFGLQIASQRECEFSGKGKNDDTFFGKYNLKKRPYLGPTSTDHELALLMANQAQCKPGDLVYDPFVGTGSIAVACQHFGVCMIGSDIDMRVIKGYGVGRKTRNTGIEGLDKIQKFDIRTNF
jgi:tRNA (guanine10-N2)-methyltransferase